MTAEIIKPQFGMSAQKRVNGFAPDIKSKSDIVGLLSNEHAYIRGKGDWRSTKSDKLHSFKGKAFRYVIYIHDRDYPGEISSQAATDLNTLAEEEANIAQSEKLDILAVLRLDEPFEAQWPKERGLASLNELISNPIDTRFKNDSEVIIKLSPAGAD